MSEMKLKRKEEQGILADHHAKLRQLNKEVTDLKEARDVAEHKHDDVVDEHGFLLREAVREAKLVERHHYAKLVEMEKEKAQGIQRKLLQENEGEVKAIVKAQKSEMKVLLKEKEGEVKAAVKAQKSEMKVLKVSTSCTSPCSLSSPRFICFSS